MEEKRNNQIGILCPVCGKYLFVIDEYNAQDYCTECGWIFDEEQIGNPDLKNGSNDITLNEYKEWYKIKIKENPAYNYIKSNYVAQPHICPVCGKHQFPEVSSFEICPVCGWEDDSLMEKEPDCWAGTSNDLSLNEYRKRYMKQQK